MIIKLLLEDKATDYLKKMIKQNCAAMFKPYLEIPVKDLPDNLKEKLKEYNGELLDKCSASGANLLMFLRLDFLQYFDIRHGEGPVKYTIGLARIGIGELGYFKNANNVNEMALLKQLTLFAFNNDVANKTLDADFNGMTYNELKKCLNGERKRFNEKNRLTLANQNVNEAKFHYTVVPINSSEDAKRYGKYTSWCITHGSYHQYAKGGARFYFCLADGFEDIDATPGENCPLDDYGLSMVSVLIDMEGEPTIVTTRWNHEHDGENNENLHTAEQVQNMLGIPFYETFKPYTKEELQSMGIVSFEEFEDRLNSGENPISIILNQWDPYSSDGYRAYDDEDYDDEDYDEDFDEDDVSNDPTYMIMPDDDGYKVSMNGKYNYVYKSGKILSSRWFDDMTSFDEGYAVVALNDKFNFIDKSGNYLLDKWCDRANEFSEGYATIYYDDQGGWNLIDKSGNLILDKWYERVDTFKDGYCVVRDDNRRFNAIDKSGNYVFPSWLHDAIQVAGEGYFSIWKHNRNNVEVNCINKSGKYLFKHWYNFLGDFSNGYALVERRRGNTSECNFINKSEECLLKDWVSNARAVREGYGSVFNESLGWNFIDSSGKYLSKEWFKNTHGGFYDGFAAVMNDNSRWNFLKKSGDYLSELWFDDVHDFNYGNSCTIVQLEGKYNLIDKSGKLLFRQWADVCHFLYDGGFVAAIDGQKYFIDKNGNISQV